MIVVKNVKDIPYEEGVYCLLSWLIDHMVSADYLENDISQSSYLVCRLVSR